MGYDALGNITSKSDVAGSTYTYGSSRPHAVTAAGGNSYVYDSNGNMTSRAGQVIDWTSYNQVRKINSAGSPNTEFWFGAGRERVVQKNSNGTTTIYVGSLFEKVTTSGGLIEEKHYIMTPLGRTAVRTVRNDTKVETRYFHQDGLGSIVAVTTESGKVEQRFTFDAWGKRAKTVDLHTANGGDQTRGYTDHEHLEDFGLIHMNGRVYDPLLGRFLSADPFIDDARDSQAYNRYSYVSNNPLNATDPSGFFKLKDALKIVAVIVVSIVTYGAATAAMGSLLAGTALAGTAAAATITTGVAMTAAGFASGFAGSLLNGGSIGDAFKAGLYGAATGAATFLGGAVGGALASGWIAENQGGSFGVGFATSMVGSLAGMYSGNWYARLALASVAGGTVAEIGGGKFANGAYSAAFAYVIRNPPTAKNLGFASDTTSSGKDAVHRAVASGRQIASAHGDMYTDGSVPWVTNGGEAAAAGKAGPLSVTSWLIRASTFVRLPTCMDCHGLGWRDRAAIGPPMDQAWFNRDGTETATKVYLAGSTIPAIIGIGMAESPATTGFIIKALLDLWTSNDQRFPTTPLDPPVETPWSPPSVPTGPGVPPPPPPPDPYPYPYPMPR